MSVDLREVSNLEQPSSVDFGNYTPDWVRTNFGMLNEESQKERIVQCINSKRYHFVLESMALCIGVEKTIKYIAHDEDLVKGFLYAMVRIDSRITVYSVVTELQKLDDQSLIQLAKDLTVAYNQGLLREKLHSVVIGNLPE